MLLAWHRRKKVKANEEKPPSRRTVVCGECSKRLERWESLKPHFDTVHEDRPPFEKGQTKLKLLGYPSAKTSVSQNENLTLSSEDLRHSRSGSIEPLSPPGTPVFILSQLGATQCEDNDVLFGEMRNLLDQLELNVCTPRVDISVPATVSHQSKTKSKVHPESSRTLSHAIKEDRFTRQLNLLLETSCLKHIENLLDDFFELNLERTELHCLYCFDNTPKHGNFDVEGVEYESLHVRSQKFRNLAKLLRKHINLESYQMKVKEGEIGEAKKSERYREMGRRLRTLAYFIYFNDLSMIL